VNFLLPSHKQVFKYPSKNLVHVVSQEIWHPLNLPPPPRPYFLGEQYDRVWREKISKNNQLYLYSKVHTKNEVSHWWIIARKNPSFMKEINNVIRIICGSYKVRGKRVETI
jgi:hypothetical protein